MRDLLEVSLKLDQLVMLNSNALVDNMHLQLLCCLAVAGLNHDRTSGSAELERVCDQIH